MGERQTIVPPEAQLYAQEAQRIDTSLADTFRHVVEDTIACHPLPEPPERMTITDYLAGFVDPRSALFRIREQEAYDMHKKNHTVQVGKLRELAKNFGNITVFKRGVDTDSDFDPLIDLNASGDY